MELLHGSSWFLCCLVVLIILFIICCINMCIHYPGLLEFTCGKKCMAWNHEDIELENKDGDFYSSEALDNSSEDEEDSDIEDRVLPLIKKEEERKSIHCETVNELDKNGKKVHLIKKQMSIHEDKTMEKVNLLQKQKSINEDNKIVKMNLVQTQRSKAEDLNGNGALEESSEDEDDDSIEERVLPLLKGEEPGGKEML